MEALACEPYPATQSTDGGHERKHCWECERRYLVCDSTRPSCMRCSKLGVVCPGYGAMKPVNLKWLSPGQVKSRKRRPKIMFNDHSTGSEEDLLFTNAQHIVPTSPCFQIRTVTEMLVQAAEYCGSAPCLCINDRFSQETDMFDSQSESGAIGQAYEWDNTKFRRPLDIASNFPEWLGLPRPCPTCSGLHIPWSFDVPEWGKLDCAISHIFLFPWPDYQVVTRWHQLRRKKDRQFCNCRNADTAPDRCEWIISEIPRNVGLIVFCSKVRQGISHKSWRYHLDGVRTAIQLRGGFRVFGESPGAMPLLHSFMVYVNRDWNPIEKAKLTFL